MAASIIGSSAATRKAAETIAASPEAIAWIEARLIEQRKVELVAQGQHLAMILAARGYLVESVGDGISISVGQSQRLLGHSETRSIFEAAERLVAKLRVTADQLEKMSQQHAEQQHPTQDGPTAT